HAHATGRRENATDANNLTAILLGIAAHVRMPIFVLSVQNFVGIVPALFCAVILVLAQNDLDRPSILFIVKDAFTDDGLRADRPIGVNDACWCPVRERDRAGFRFGLCRRQTRDVAVHDDSPLMPPWPGGGVRGL